MFRNDNVTLQEKYKSYVTNGKPTLKLIGNLIILMVCTLSGTFRTSKILFHIKQCVRFVMKANKSISSSIEIFMVCNKDIYYMYTCILAKN